MFRSLLQFAKPTTTKIFRQMGYGIKKRNKLFRRYWIDHQQQCFGLQKRWIETAVKAEHAIILGAGFLFDLDKALFADAFSQLTFVDGNPRCRAYWRSFRRAFPVAVEQRVEEISAVIGTWEKQLRIQLQGKPSWQDALEIVNSFSKRELPRSSFFAESSESAIVSLNLLSQLPLAWQEIVESCLGKVFGKRFVDRRQDQWLQSFLPSAKLLVEQHLRDLVESGAQSILLITDQEYCNYQLAKYSRATQPAVTYDNTRGWQRAVGVIPNEVELLIEVTPALYGVELQSWLTKAAPQYQLEPLSNWLWHIAPPGAEGQNKGLSHLVQGIFLSRRTQ